MLMIKRHLGFTLIELMIVVAIIGILAAVAIPAYTDYLKRAKVGEAVNLLGGLKTPTEEYIASEGLWPTSITSDLGSKIAGKYTSNIKIGAGTGAVVDATKPWGTYSYVALMKAVPDANNPGEVGLEYHAGDSVWSCSLSAAGVTTALEAGLVPSNCRKAPADQ